MIKVPALTRRVGLAVFPEQTKVGGPLALAVMKEIGVTGRKRAHELTLMLVKRYTSCYTSC